MAEDWQEPDQQSRATVIYGPRGERLRVWKEVGTRDIGFRASDDNKGGSSDGGGGDGAGR